jgi:hypothetical protein
MKPGSMVTDLVLEWVLSLSQVLGRFWNLCLLGTVTKPGLQLESMEVSPGSVELVPCLSLSFLG